MNVKLNKNLLKMTILLLTIDSTSLKVKRQNQRFFTLMTYIALSQCQSIRCDVAYTVNCT